MSTDVNILGLDPNLPLWATEKTLEGVVDHLRKTYTLDQDRNEGLYEIFDFMKKHGRVTKEHLSAIRDELSRKGPQPRGGYEEVIGKATTKLEGLAGSTSGSIAGLTQFAGTTGLAGKALELFTRSGIMKTVLGFYGIRAAFRLMKQQLVGTIDAFTGYHKIGIVYHEGLLSHIDALAKLGMTHENMTEIVQKHARTISLVSIPRFMELGAELNRSKYELRQLGLTTKDAAVFLGEYLETQRLLGVFNFQDQKNISGAMMETMRSLTAYTKIMNKSREEILESQKKMLDQDDFHRMLASMEPGLAEQMKNSFETVTRAISGTLPAEQSDRIGKILTDMIASPVATASKSYRELMESGQHEFANDLLAMAESLRSGAQETNDSALAFVRRLGATAERTTRSGYQNILSMVEGTTSEYANFIGGGLARSSREIDARLKQLQDELSAKLGRDIQESEIFDLLAQNVSEETEALTGVRDQMNKTLATWDYGKIQKTFELLGVQGDSVAVSLRAVTDGLQLFENMLRRIIDWEAPSLADYPKAVGAALAGIIAALWLATGKLSAMARTMIGVGTGRGAGGLAGAAGRMRPTMARGLGAGALAAGAAGMYLGTRNLPEDSFSSILADAGVGALSGGATLGLLGPIAAAVGAAGGAGISLYQNRERIAGLLADRAGRPARVTQADEQPERIRTEQENVTQDLQAAINSRNEDDPTIRILRQIATSAETQARLLFQVERQIRAGATGPTGLG